MSDFISRRDCRNLSAKVKKYISQVDAETVARARVSLTRDTEEWLCQRPKFLTAERDISGGTGEIEDRQLGLPLSLTPMEQSDIPTLCDMEMSMRVASAFAALEVIIDMADQLRSLADRTRTQGEKAAEALARLVKSDVATQSVSKARRYEWERNKAIADWNAHFDAVKDAGRQDSCDFKGLARITKQDTFLKKSVHQNRAPHDSRRSERAIDFYNRSYSTHEMGKGSNGRIRALTFDRTKRLPERKSKRKAKMALIEEDEEPKEAPGISLFSWSDGTEETDSCSSGHLGRGKSCNRRLECRSWCVLL